MPTAPEYPGHKCTELSESLCRVETKIGLGLGFQSQQNAVVKCLLLASVGNKSKLQSNGQKVRTPVNRTNPPLGETEFELLHSYFIW